MLVLLLLYLFVTAQVEASCRGSCGACARRYGCMTPAWGKCCTQFFMHNGRKRSMEAKPNQEEAGMESFIEYVRLKSKMVNRPSLDGAATSGLTLDHFRRPALSAHADTSLPPGDNYRQHSSLGGSRPGQEPDDAWSEFTDSQRTLHR